MKRRIQYLLGAAIALSKPFFLGTVAIGIGMAGQGGFASLYLRYFLYAQVIPAICLFFLYLDEIKYAAFRPLLFILEGGLVLIALAAFAAAVFDTQNLLLAASDMAGLRKSAAAFAAALVADLVAIVVPIASKRRNDGGDA